MVNFEGQSVQELTEAFHEAVDDYLAYCEEEGVQPHKSYSGSLNVRLTLRYIAISQCWHSVQVSLSMLSSNKHWRSKLQLCYRIEIHSVIIIL